MSNKTCWLVDEENGIATDGKRYWCAKKSWKCCEGMISLDHAVKVLAKAMFEKANTPAGISRCPYYWENISQELKQEYIDEARELLK